MYFWATPLEAVVVEVGVVAVVEAAGVAAAVPHGDGCAAAASVTDGESEELSVGSGVSTDVEAFGGGVVRSLMQ